MSVINDMLRDLDKRQAPELGVAQSSPQESLIGPQKSPFKNIALIVLAVLVILLVLYVFFLKADTSSISPKDTLASTKHTDEVTSAVPQAQRLSKNTQNQTLVNSTKQISTANEKQTHLVDNQAKGEGLVIQSTSKVDASTKQVHQQVTMVTTEDKQQPVKEIVIEQPATSDKQKKTPSTALVASKLEKTQPQSAIAQAERLEQTLPKKDFPEEKTIDQASADKKTMQVSLSPVALDQQMAERALMLMSKRQETQAYRQLYAFIGEHEEDMESRTVLATYLLQENRIAEVGDVLLNAPLYKSPKLRQIKARWHVQRGESSLALHTLNSDLPEVTNYPDYYVLLAAYYQRYGSAQDAQATYALLVEYDETVADWWAGLALASDRNNEKEKAYYAYQQAIDLSGLSPELVNFVKQRLTQLESVQSSLKK